ncbi:MAG TPA: protein kinase, partial [Waterburya sp.]
MTPTLLNNRYRILQTLGAGGFGNTFLAEDTHMPSGRRCVIKQLKPLTHEPQTYEIVKERFKREGAVLEELGDGNNQIPRLFAYFSEAGQFYLVQEYIEGDTLTKKVEQGGPLSESEVKKILMSLLSVLDYVHSRRMIHRDIKPDNIIIRQRDGLPVLIDFGAVKEAMNTQVATPGAPAQSMVIGTPGFMPAEQAGGRPTYASDLYGLGLTAVFLLTGKTPQDLRTDDRTGEFLWRQYAPNINPNLAMVIDRAIRFNARDRFATAKDMLNALQSGDAVSEMATVAVAPGKLPHTPNPQTAPINYPSPQQPVPVGNSPVIQGNRRNPLMIGALVAGGLIVGGMALAVGLSRSPERSSPVASNSQPAKDSSTSQPPPAPLPPSRSQSTDSEPTSEQPTTEQPSSPARSRSQQDKSVPSPVLPDSPSRRSPEGRDSQKPSSQTSPSEPSQFPSSVPENNSQPSNLTKRIPSFAPGTQQSYIKQELGEPTKKSKGMWNTRALLYEDYIPGQVSLGYLYDPSSGRLRETEASFADSV